LNNLIILNYKIDPMLPKGVHIDGVPAELEALLGTDAKAKAFFESLSKSYKQGYCDWVGSAKQEETRKTRAEKALVMLQKEQKTLKT
jgi:uncharacterized protein YdeI (YjbR/CyaY-like superfamily)